MDGQGHLNNNNVLKHSERAALALLAPSGAQGVTMYVCFFAHMVQVCLELSIFIILAQVSLMALSQVSQLSKLTW